VSRVYICIVKAIFDETKKQTKMKKQTKNDVIVLLNDNAKPNLSSGKKSKPTKAELALQKERANEKKLIWKALNYSFHKYASRGQVVEAIEMSDMLKKYFPGFVDVDEDFKGMIRPKFNKPIHN